MMMKRVGCLNRWNTRVFIPCDKSPVSPESKICTFSHEASCKFPKYQPVQLKSYQSHFLNYDGECRPSLKFLPY